MTSSPHGLYVQGCTCYNGVNKGTQTRERANLKNTPQFRLQAATRLHEVGIAASAGQQHRGDVFLSLVHRPSATKGGHQSPHCWAKMKLLGGTKS